MRLRRVLRSPILYWPCAALLALATASLIERRTQQSGTVPVVIIRARTINAGHRLVPDDVVLRHVAADAVPRDAARSVDAVVGRAPLETLVAAEIVRTARLAARDREGTAVFIGTDRRAVAVPTNEGALVLRRGDHVDVLATLQADGAGGTAVSRVVSADALVIDVADKRITVSVPAADAPAVATALVTGSVTLAQR